jgi:hypothetical protein
MSNFLTVLCLVVSLVGNVYLFNLVLNMNKEIKRVYDLYWQLKSK